MDKPTLPDNPTIRQIVKYEADMFMWEREQMSLHFSREGAYMRACVARGHTIDRRGYRVVFVAQNSRGVMQFFNTSPEAVKCARESKNQPVRIIAMPILPVSTNWDTPIDKLEILIREELSK